MIFCRISSSTILSCEKGVSRDEYDKKDRHLRQQPANYEYLWESDVKLLLYRFYADILLISVFGKYFLMINHSAR